MKSTYTDAEYTALPFSAQAHAHCVQITAPPIRNKEVPVQQIIDSRRVKCTFTILLSMNKSWPGGRHPQVRKRGSSPAKVVEQLRSR